MKKRTEKFLKMLMVIFAISIFVVPMKVGAAEQQNVSPVLKEEGAYAVEDKQKSILLEDVSGTMTNTFSYEVGLMKINRDEYTLYRTFEASVKTNLYGELNKAFEEGDSVSLISDLWDTEKTPLNPVSGKDLRIYVPFRSNNQEAVEHIENVVYNHIQPYVTDSFVKVIYLDDDIDKGEGTILLKSETAIERDRIAEQERIRAEEEARIKAEEEARIRAEEEARIREEEEARIRAEEEARIRAEEEARIQVEENARIQAEKEARIQAVKEWIRNILLICSIPIVLVLLVLLVFVIIMLAYFLITILAVILKYIWDVIVFILTPIVKPIVKILEYVYEKIDYFMYKHPKIRIVVNTIFIISVTSLLIAVLIMTESKIFFILLLGWIGILYIIFEEKIKKVEQEVKAIFVGIWEFFLEVLEVYIVLLLSPIVIVIEVILVLIEKIVYLIKILQILNSIHNNVIIVANIEDSIFAETINKILKKKEKAFIVQGEKVIKKEKNVSISEYRNIDSLKIALETCRVNEFSAVLITDKESEVKMFEKEECIKKIILPEYLKGDVKELIKTKGIYL